MTLIRQAACDRTGPASASLSAHGLGLGTQVLTGDGVLPVEFLTPGDRIVTSDRGMVRLAKVTYTDVSPCHVLKLPDDAVEAEGYDRVPVIHLGARQLVVLRDWRAQLLFNRSMAVAEAHTLLRADLVETAGGGRARRIFRLHFEGERHLVMLAGGPEIMSAGPVTMSIAVRAPRQRPGARQASA